MKVEKLYVNILNNRKLDNKQNYFMSNSYAPRTSFPADIKLMALQKDIVTFGAMKKTQFDGLDYAVVEKFKAPIEKFHSEQDLQNWAETQIEELQQKDFDGRREETDIQRRAMLEEWTDYVLNENDAYNMTTALLILNSITKDLKPDNDKLPPVLNKGVLADCISEIDKNIKADKKYQFDLKKMYETKLRALYSDDLSTGETSSKWVIIPSEEHDPENFEENVEKLKTLSHKNWCTKSFNAEPYLLEGDFHIYLESGQPKLGVRFIGDEIQEIQGENNNSIIPISYFDEMEKHIKDNDLKLTKYAKSEVQDAEYVKAEISKIKKELDDIIKSKDAKAVFEYFGMEPEEDADGLLSIAKYKPISDLYSFEDIGINEDWLCKNLKYIKGNADFMHSSVKELPNLIRIGGSADFQYSTIVNLKNLKSVGRYADFSNSAIQELPNLVYVRGDLGCKNTRIKSIPKLRYIGYNAYFDNTEVTDLKNLKTICGEANFDNSKIKELPNLVSIGDEARFVGSVIKSLPKLEYIGGRAILKHSQIEDLNNLVRIGGDVYFNSRIKEIPKLKSIGGNANFMDSQITELPKLKSIGGNANFMDSQIVELPKLKSIGGNADFRNSQLTELPKLVFIGGNANFRNSVIKNLNPNLQIRGENY